MESLKRFDFNIVKPMHDSPLGCKEGRISVPVSVGMFIKSDDKQRSAVE